METYNIADILPLYNNFNNSMILPPKHVQPRTITNAKLKTPYNSSFSEDEIESDLNEYLDIDDNEFVKHNMEQGQYAEDYVKKVMELQYGNCEKVKAKEGFDFKVIIKDREIKLEVKSLQNYNSPFHITINEINHAVVYKDDYFLCFVILPSIQVGVKDIKLLSDPIRNLDISISTLNNIVSTEKCTIVPEKFLIKPKKNLIKLLKSNFEYEN